MVMIGQPEEYDILSSRESQTPPLPLLSYSLRSHESLIIGVPITLISSYYSHKAERLQSTFVPQSTSSSNSHPLTEKCSNLDHKAVAILPSVVRELLKVQMEMQVP